MKIKFHITLYIALLFTSYNIAAKEVENWVQQSNTSVFSIHSEDNYPKAEKKIVKPYIPIGFEEYNIPQYKVTLAFLHTINRLPYFNFNKVALHTDLNFKKRVATYTENKEFILFRSIFETVNFKEKYTVFNTSYNTSTRKQTFTINLTIPFEANFDGYIEKKKF